MDRGGPGWISEALGRLLQEARQYLLLVANEHLDEELRAKVGPSDMVQETFLEAQRDFADFRGRTGDELLGWLRRILLNNLANFTRHYRATAKRALDREVPLRDTLSGNLAGPAESPSSQAITRERDEALWAAIERLPEPARQVIRWRNYERCSFEEIGQRLGRSAEAARKLWARALDELQRSMESPDGSQ